MPTDVTAVKAGSSKVSAVVRRKLFAERYLVNGRNGTEAAMHVGAPEAGARVAAHNWLKHPDVKALIEARTTEVLAEATLNTERWAKEMAAIGHFDPGELYDEGGNLIPIHQLPVHVRKAISSVKREHRTVGKGEERETVMTEEVKLWDKNAALANIGRHLGVFEKDNKQNVTAIQVNLTLVGR